MTNRWPPFSVIEIETAGTALPKPESPRSIHSIEGIGDRMRVAAFAEIQARDAFLWAIGRFPDAPDSLKQDWVRLSGDEQRHLDSLLARMAELGIDPQGRTLTNDLWVSLTTCQTLREFMLFIANAEERGRKAGMRFFESLHERDPVTAEIFRKIAEEEVAHIALAQIYFPDAVLSPEGVRKK